MLEILMIRNNSASRVEIIRARAPSFKIYIDQISCNKIISQFFSKRMSQATVLIT